MDRSFAFAHGIASGDPLPDRVIIWTRLSGVAPGEDATVSWCLGRDHRLSDLVAQGTAVAAAGRDHTVHVDVTGLEPGTTYFYGFDVPGAVSAVGRTNTLPAGHVERARFALASCAKFNAGFFNAYDRIADRGEVGELDFLLHLGDFIYEVVQYPEQVAANGKRYDRTITFPVKVYSMVRFSVTPEVNAASAILIFLTILLTTVALKLQDFTKATA